MTKMLRCILTLTVGGTRDQNVKRLGLNSDNVTQLIYDKYTFISIYIEFQQIILRETSFPSISKDSELSIQYETLLHYWSHPRQTCKRRGKYILL